MKKIFFLALFLILFGLAPVVTLAADGCSSAGPVCTVNNYAGVCAQNLESGDFYCRPTVLNQPSSGGSTVTCTPGTFCALAPIPGLTQDITADTAGLANFFNNLYKFAVGMAAALAVIMIIWGGLEYSTQDSISKKSDGKKRIYNAIFGLVLVLSPVLVFSIINPSILNLSINLERLDTKSGTINGTGNGTTTRIPHGTDSTSGCTVSGTSGILQIAVCSSSSSATTWGGTCTGNLSTGPRIVLANGTVTSVVLLCAGNKNYVFLQLKEFLSFPINSLRPLSITTDNPNNANDAINFASICRGANIGWKTCISNDPALSSSVACLPTPRTPLRAGSFTGCFNERLSCEDPTLGALSLKCAENPSWTPFQ